MALFEMLKIAWLVLLVLANGMHFGEALAADRNHRWSSDEAAVRDVGNVSVYKDGVESASLQYANHSQGSFAKNGSSSTSHSVAEEPERHASGIVSTYTDANRSLSRIHGHDSTNTSVSKSSGNKTAADLNVSSTEQVLNDVRRTNASDSADALKYSQAENIVRATLCANGSVEKETMHVEVEFASTLLENGLYY